MNKKLILIMISMVVIMQPVHAVWYNPFTWFAPEPVEKFSKEELEKLAAAELQRQADEQKKQTLLIAAGTAAVGLVSCAIGYKLYCALYAPQVAAKVGAGMLSSLGGFMASCGRKAKFMLGLGGLACSGTSLCNGLMKCWEKLAVLGTFYNTYVSLQIRTGVNELRKENRQAHAMTQQQLQDIQGRVVNVEGVVGRTHEEVMRSGQVLDRHSQQLQRIEVAVGRLQQQRQRPYAQQEVVQQEPVLN